jgi:hypothetical protein
MVGKNKEYKILLAKRRENLSLRRQTQLLGIILS